MSSSDSYTWVSEHDDILNRIASTNLVQNDWKQLRLMIKYKLEMGVKIIMSDTSGKPPEASLRRGEQPSGDPSPEMLSLWLVIPPSAPRRPDQQVIKVLPKQMTEEQASAKVAELNKLIDGFQLKAPFTIQRICELVMHPQEYYNVVGKYLRAIERNLLVTSTWDEYITDTYNDAATMASLPSSQALAHATTPLFSPIPFLINRSRSGSPSLPSPSRSVLILDERKPLPGDDSSSQESLSTDDGDENIPPTRFDGSSSGMSLAQVRTLKVDELDHEEVSPNSPLLQPSTPVFSPPKRSAHLADHPEAFSATTTVPPAPMSPPQALRPRATSPPPLASRFVRASTPEPSPTRLMQEARRKEAEVAKEKTSGSTITQEKEKSPAPNSEEAEEGEIEDIVMKQ